MRIGRRRAVKVGVAMGAAALLVGCGSGIAGIIRKIEDPGGTPPAGGAPPPGGGTTTPPSGGTTTPPSSPCGLDVYSPNYAARLGELLQWSGFPVRVAFTHDANWTADRQANAIAGFQQWADATSAGVKFAVIDSTGSPDISVRFDPSTSGGLTQVSYSGSSLIHADVNVGVQDLTAPDMQAIAAHEFGHALGIEGHSDDPADLMYPVHTLGTAAPVTARDLNTLKTCYCGVFPQSSRRATPRGAPQTLRIE